MKTKTILHWTIFLFFNLACCFSKKAFSQTESHNFVTYDTVMTLSGLPGEPIITCRISRPANMFTPGNADTASRPVIIFMPGDGEQGTDPSKLVVWGPHYLMNHGWDGGVQLGNGKHFPIIISVITNSANARGIYMRQWLDTMRRHYHIKWNSLHVTGLSKGGITWGRTICYQQNANDFTTMQMIRSFAAMEGCSGAVDGINPTTGTAQWAPFGLWANKFDGRYFAVMGTADVQNTWYAAKSIKDSLTANGKPNTAFFTMETLGGGAHCCWNNMYDPNANQWLTGSYVGTNTNYPNQTGNYYEQMGVFQWMLRQGDTSLVGSTDMPPVVNAGSNITVLYPANSTPLSGSVSDPDGSIVTYNWSKISGPSQYNISNTNTLNPMVSNLTFGIYMFQLTATDNLGMTSSSQVQILSTTTLPITYLNFTGISSGGINHLTWETTMEDGMFELERSSDGKTFTVLTNIPVSGEPTHTYFYDDHSPFPGEGYYRIKNISAAGAETFSKVIEITSGEEKSTVSFYPNPARDYVNVQLQSKERGPAIIRLLDLEGRILLQQQGMKTDELYSGKLSLNRMAPGLYIVYYSIGNKVHSLGKIAKY